MNFFQTKIVKIEQPLQSIELRPLTGKDASAYFEWREYVLKSGDGRFFSDSYEREQTLETERLRRNWCMEKPDHCIVGAFFCHRLIGFVMITRYGPQEDKTVEWEAAWVHPHYRRSGLARALYEKVEEWTINQGYRFVKSFIRDDNEKWLGIRRKLGFVEIGTQYVSHWADNTSGNMIVFRRDLYAPKPQILQQPQLLCYASIPRKTAHQTAAKHFLHTSPCLQSTGTE